MTQADARPALVEPPAPTGPGATALRPDDPRAARRAAFGSRRPWLVALVLYTMLVAFVVGWPTPVDAGVNDAIYAELHRLRAAGWPEWFTYDFLERAANVAMFVPLGLLVTRVTRRPWWGLVVPAALSGGAELAQHVLRPERFATWVDVATNTSGGALGVVLAVLVMGRGTPVSRAWRRRRARTRRRAASPSR